MLGNIYKGKITKIMKALGIAFVELGCEKQPIMKLNGKSHSEGDEVICQFIKLPIEDKGGEVTENFSVSDGFFAIVKTDSKECKISNKITDSNQKERLYNLMINACDGIFTIIARTESTTESNDVLLENLQKLALEFKRIDTLGKFKSIGTLLYDNEDETEAFSGSAKVDLICGGNIIIEKTSALISVDINTKNANFIDKIDKMPYIINTEGIKALFEQLGLLNITGIIVVDLLKMKDEDEIKNIEILASELAKQDQDKTISYGINRNLGLLEMIRSLKR